MKNWDNIQPTPNPKMITVQRIRNIVKDPDGWTKDEILLIHNVEIHPLDIPRR